jgi:hypothetical protein
MLDVAAAGEDEPVRDGNGQGLVWARRDAPKMPKKATPITNGKRSGGLGFMIADYMEHLAFWTRKLIDFWKKCVTTAPLRGT